MAPERDEQRPKRLSTEPWMEPWDQVIAESFPASDPPAPPASIGGPDREAQDEAAREDPTG